MSNELFEMANVSKKDTKLPYDIWIDSKGKNRNTKQNYPRLKVDYETIETNPSFAQQR